MRMRRMKKIKEYNVNDSVEIGGKYIFYRGKKVETDERVIIKTLNHYDPSLLEKAQLQHEYFLLDRLSKQAKHIPHALEFIDSEDMPGVAILDEGERTLSAWLGRKSLPLESFLPLGIAITEALEEIHSADIIHKNLTLQNILYNPETLDVKIADFSFATEFNRTIMPNDPPRMLQGTLEYMAPEQTGRMNRPLTRRADLYSLGVIFYKLLTNSLPFEAKDPEALIRSHLLKTPLSPKEKNAEVPEILSKIVMKLLSKMPQDRYKSATGLKNDLERCFQEYKKTSTFPLFELGQDDFAANLELPDRLYGREEHIQKIMTLFNVLCEKEDSILLAVSGYSGKGKTSIVHELSKKVSLTNGFFVQGKFDSFQQSDTYEGLRKALDKLVQYLILLPEEDYLRLRYNLINEAGPILKVITDMIPRLKAIVGEPPALSEISPEQTKNRFQLAFHKFIKVITTDRPVILFLDDLQWANGSMLELLEKIISSKDIKNLFLIISYRSNEVTTGDPVDIFLNSVANKKTVYSMDVEPLGANVLCELLQDILYLPKERIEKLALIMSRKTEGNPLFLLMMLEDLYREKYIFFSKDKKQWDWNNEKISNALEVDNVVDFVERMIHALPQETREILHLASCVGNTFSLADIAYSIDQTPFSIVSALIPAMKIGIILPLNLQDEWMVGTDNNILLSSEFRFMHDRIQQAAYQLKTIEDTKKTHLEIGRGWERSYTDKNDSIRIIATADQFDKGLSYIANKEEKKRVCELNYQAASFAIQFVAYERAYYYSKISLELLDADAWNNSYELCYNIYLNAIRSAFLFRELSYSEELAEIAAQKASNPFDKARILSLKATLYRAMGKRKEALASTEEALRLLKQKDVLTNPNILGYLFCILKAKYYFSIKRSPLIALPTEYSNQENLIYNLTQSFSEEFYLSGDLHRWSYSLLTWFSSTFDRQNCYLRALGYIAHSIIWPHTQYAHDLFEEARKMLERSKTIEHQTTLYCVGVILHGPWHTPIHELLPFVNKAVEVSEQAGNLDFLSFTYLYRIAFNFKLSLPKMIEEINLHSTLVHEISPRVFMLFKIFKQYCRNMVGITSPNCWDDDFFSGPELEKFCKENQYFVGLSTYYIFKMMMSVQFKEHEKGKEAQLKLLPELDKIVKTNNYFRILRLLFYSFILDAHSYPSLSFIEKIRAKSRMNKIYKNIHLWSRLSPANFSLFDSFMRAEMFCLKNNFDMAIKNYEEAINLALESNQAEYAGLACEYCADICIKTNKERLVSFYINKAIKIYSDWGALGKVSFLRTYYAKFLQNES